MLGLLLAAGLVLAGLLFPPFESWLSGGTVTDLPRSTVVNTTAFTRLFPPTGPGERLVFLHEKRGFRKAKREQRDQTRAVPAISDTRTAPTS